jgi:2Fe-2S ferredoxin
MVQIIVEGDDGEKTPYEAIEGWTLMEILRDYGLPVKAECGGACSCATCQVYIDEAWLDKLPPMRDDEEEMLDTAPDVQDNSRLSCQIVISEDLDGLTLKIAKNF